MSIDLNSTVSPRYDDKKASNPHSPSSRSDPFDMLATETIVEIFSYSYPVVHLPAEILQKKFRSRYISNPTRLSMVCNRWHAIMMTNYSLWATITIKPLEINQYDWVHWGFLQLRSHLERSGAYPLNIRIENHIENNINIKDEVIHGILDIVMLHSKRWRSIAFAFALKREYMQKFNILNGCLPLLEHLEINLCDSIYDDDKSTCPSFLTASKLNSLRIDPSLGMDIIRRIQIPWAQICDLTFGDSEFDNATDLYEILGWLSVSLLSLTFLESFEIGDWRGTYSRQITLPQLRRLYVLGDCVSTVLDLLICPSLEELESTHAFEGTVKEFLDYSSCTLTHITLCDIIEDFELYSPEYHSILQHPSLSTLKSISLLDITDSMLDLLNFDSHQLFPSLETLHLCLWFERKSRGQELLLSMIKEIQKVIDSRTRTSNRIQRDARSSLRECFFKFQLPRRPYEDSFWDEEPIHALQSIHASRNIRISLKISSC